MEEQHFLVTPTVPLTFMYNYRVGPYLERYIQGLSEKKILGVRCPGCKRVILPPRSACGQCGSRPDEWVQVEPVGTLENFTVGRVTIEKGEIKDLDHPVILGMIRLDGADSLLSAKVQGIAPEECRTGIRVQAVWREEPRGDLLDLDHFKPVA